MSKPQQQQQRVVTAVTISLSAQMKMALHATKHGMSNCQIHGIVLGSTTTTTSSAPSSTSSASSVSVVVTDVVPVCHEVPTKPIVDSALRLVDAHLRLSSTTATATTRIIGWYTANDNTNADKEEEDDDDEEEGVPNPSACKIASSIAAATTATTNDNDDTTTLLLLLSTNRLVHCIKNDHNGLPICTVYITGSSSSTPFTQKVNDTLVTTTTMTTKEKEEDGVTKCNNINNNNNSIAQAIEQQLNSIILTSSTTSNNKSNDGGYIFDFVDHLNNHILGEDWITNGIVDTMFF